MSEAEDHKDDMRQPGNLRAWRQLTPGEPRLHHLSGPTESYVLSAWHVGVGSIVHALQTIATIETKSFTLNFESYESGVLAQQCFAVGDVIPDGAVVARITPTTEEPNNEARKA